LLKPYQKLTKVESHQEKYFFENQDKQKSHSREKKGVFHGFQEQKGIHFCIIIVSFDQFSSF